MSSSTIFFMFDHQSVWAAMATQVLSPLVPADNHVKYPIWMLRVGIGIFLCISIWFQTIETQIFHLHFRMIFQSCLLLTSKDHKPLQKKKEKKNGLIIASEMPLHVRRDHCKSGRKHLAKLPYSSRTRGLTSPALPRLDESNIDRKIQVWSLKCE